MMTIEEIQKAIEKTDYCDMPILRFDVQYFGDEVILNIMGDEADKGSYWEIRFLRCQKVCYETDAAIRNIPYVKNLAWNQRDYFGQEICVSPSELKGFYTIKLNLDFLMVKIVCGEVHVDFIHTNGQVDCII